MPVAFVLFEAESRNLITKLCLSRNKLIITTVQWKREERREENRETQTASSSVIEVTKEAVNRSTVDRMTWPKKWE